MPTKHKYIYKKKTKEKKSASSRCFNYGDSESIREFNRTLETFRLCAIRNVFIVQNSRCEILKLIIVL